MNSLSAAGYRINGNLNEGVGDAGIATPTAGTFAVVNGAYGQLGKIFYLDTQELLQYTNPLGTIGTLYGGWYKYVHFKSTWSATLAVGQPLFYADATALLANEVTPDAAAAQMFAGYCLAAGTVKGNYWWIQVGGLANALCKASSVTSNVAGDLAVQTGDTTATTDGIADATDYFTTALKYKLVRGVWVDAPAAGALKRLLMAPLPMVQ